MEWSLGEVDVSSCEVFLVQSCQSQCPGDYLDPQRSQARGSVTEGQVELSSQCVCFLQRDLKEKTEGILYFFSLV